MVDLCLYIYVYRCLYLCLDGLSISKSIYGTSARPLLTPNHHLLGIETQLNGLLLVLLSLPLFEFFQLDEEFHKLK